MHVHFLIISRFARASFVVSTLKYRSMCAYVVEVLKCVYVIRMHVSLMQRPVSRTCTNTKHVPSYSKLLVSTDLLKSTQLPRNNFYLST